MPVIEEDGKGGSRRTSRARKERKGARKELDLAVAEQHLHAAVHPWLEGAGLCPALRCGDRELCGRFLCAWEAPAAEMLTVVNRLMGKTEATGQCPEDPVPRCPEEPLEFLGYRIGLELSPTDGSRYIGTRPSRASVQSICRRISEQTARRYQGWRAEEVVGRLNRDDVGWANYFTIGQVSPAYEAVCTLDPAAATVVAAKAKGEEEELRAILQHTAVHSLRSFRRCRGTFRVRRHDPD